MQQHKLRSVTSDDDANRWEMRFSSAFCKQKGNLMIHLYSLAQCDSTQFRSFTFFSSSLRIVSKIVIGRVLNQKDSFQLKVWVYLDVWMMTQRRRVIGLEFNLFELSSIVSRELCSVMWFLFSWIRLLKAATEYDFHYFAIDLEENHLKEILLVVLLRNAWKSCDVIERLDSNF